MQLGEIIELTKTDEQPAVALTDTGNLFGALEFSEKAYSEGIQPIIGCQMPVDFGSDPTNHRESDGLYDIVLLASSEDGIANLIKLVSTAYKTSDSSTRPHVGLDMLSDRHDGLIALTGGIQGPLRSALDSNRPEDAETRLCNLKNLFGDHLYVELQRHKTPTEKQFELAIVDLAYEQGLPLVGTNEPFFGKKDMYEAHDAFLCIADARTINEDDRRRVTSEHFFKSGAEMIKLFSDIPEAYENTIEIAKRCHVKLNTRDPILPRFVSGSDIEPDVADKAEAEELRKQAKEGLQKRIESQGYADGLSQEDYLKRLDYELDVIERMKYPGYFLIIADIIKWAKMQSIPVGPGRGSGAGSLVAYSLTITELDPLKFGLLFERFLNPDRVSMPDFDIDFCQDRREEVIRYVQEKFGHEQVAQIITFGTMQARVAIRDVGRVLQMPHGQVDRLAKLVPSMPLNIKLADAIKEEPRLKEAQKQEHVVGRLLDISMKLEGLNRHAGTHAAGIVIGDRPLEELVPIYRDPRSEMPVTQYNMKWVEQAGLVKFDFLGLKTLTMIDIAIQLIENEGVKINIDKIPIDDKATFELLARGETVGIFQLESAGMRRAIAGMKPDRFEDIIALVALYRPGPMENIPIYNNRKHGKEKPEYMHQLLEPVLKETYGIIVYQEQVMELAQVLAGYSLGEADLLRRAMGKKIRSEMDLQKDRFVNGAKENGVSESEAKEIFDLVARFADYGFNKSHAAAYALVAYQTAWLKANHPIEFMAASMTLDTASVDKLNALRQEAIRMGIEVIPPSINQSGSQFQVKDKKIYYSMAAIKGVGKLVSEHLEQVRGGEPFKSLSDLTNRISSKETNRRALECLIFAGTFDELEENRARIHNGLDRILGEVQRADKNLETGQSDFFSDIGLSDQIQLENVQPWQTEELLQKEKDVIGFYLSSHPLDSYKNLFSDLRVKMWEEFSESVKESGKLSGKLAGAILTQQERKTRAGGKLGIIKLSDPTGQFEAIIFSENLEKYREVLSPGNSVVVNVQAEVRDEEIRVIIQSVSTLESLTRNISKNLSVFMRDSSPIKNLTEQLKPQNANGSGDVTLVVIHDSGHTEVEIQLPERYEVTPKVAGALKTLPGVIDTRLT